jgi:hypothetical protein
MGIQDLLAEARTLAGILTADGLKKQASYITGALDARAPAPEVLMAVRYHLKDALEGAQLRSHATRKRIRRFTTALSEKL